MMDSDYDALKYHLEEIGRLNGAMGILHWDQEVIMPEGATEARAGQMSALAGVIHEKLTDPQLKIWLNRLVEDKKIRTFDRFDQVNILESQRDYERQINVPKELVQEITELKARAHPVWVQARKDNSFADFAPCLERLVQLKTEWARCIDSEKLPYDVNIDDYERNETMEQLDPIFDQLKEELIPLIQSIQDSRKAPDHSFLKGNFPIEKQVALGKQISSEMGFDFNRGRMDVSVHPFCGGGHPTDVRITTRYRKDNFVESLYAVIHETGHGLYEQGRMEKGRNLPVSEALSMGIHESQSLFWERMIAQGKSLCSHYLGIFTKTFPAYLNRISKDTFYRAVNICKPSLIRVEADEVTYPLHVILRYEIEKGLFDGSISVHEIPHVWNDKMEHYLGIHPKTDSEGVLQDIHWSMGAFGYFPSYTLGAMYACQFYNALKREVPDVEEQIERGELAKVKSWLNKRIHSKGRLYPTYELIKIITNEEFNPYYFIDYLKKKYSEIYQLNV